MCVHRWPIEGSSDRQGWEAAIVKSDKARLYDDLKQQILTMELEPDKDLDEISLGQRYGVSRTPVREVLHRLEGEGYIAIYQNKGARVAPMNYDTLRNFFLVAPMIYAAIGRLAVQNYRPRQLMELRDTQGRFRAACQSRDAYAMVIENNRFHEVMGEMSGNAYLRPSLGRLLIDHARIGHTFFRPRTDRMRGNLALSMEHHDGFIAALEAHDETAVVDLVFDHWELSRENMEMFIAPEGMKADVTPDGQPRRVMEKAS